MGRVYSNAVSEMKPQAPKFSIKAWMIASAVVILLILAAVVAGLIMVLNPAKKPGFGSPEDMALGVVSYVGGTSDILSSDLVPAELRESDVSVSTMNLSELTDLRDKYGIDISDIKFGTSVQQDVNKVSDGIHNAYDIDIEISDAYSIPVTAAVAYTVNKKEYAADLNLDLIAMEVDSRWYLYTGESFDGQPVVSIIHSSSMGSITGGEGTVSTAESDESVPEKPVVKNLKSVEFYEDSLDDLMSGKVTIDNVEYTLPCRYADLSGLFSIRESAFKTDNDRIVRPNHIFEHVRVDFNKKSYEKTKLDVSIGNVTKNNVDVSDGVVTSLYIGNPADGYDYPVVYLPGNVTFGTPYSDIVKLYGQLEPCSDSSVIVTHSDAVSFYEIELNNRHNHLYLEFDSNDTLVAVEWYYYDLNGFAVDDQ